MSAIIDNAMTITYQRQASIAQTKSQSGKRQAQRRGPVLYNFEVEIIPMYLNSTSYLGIEKEILTSDYSANLIPTRITNGDLTAVRGNWNGAPVIKGNNQSGNSIIIEGAVANTPSYALVGDFVQFSGYSKVFQVTADANANSNGDVTLQLNGSIPVGSSPSNGTGVVFGDNVIFTLAMTRRPEPTFSNFNIVNYSNARFEEVIV